MIGHIKAEPETHLLLVTNDSGNIEHLRITIVGWQHIQGGLVFPLTTINHEGISGRRVIEHSDGRISDLNGRWEYDDLAAFEEAVGEDLPSPNDPPPDPQLLRGPIAASDKPGRLDTVLQYARSAGSGEPGGSGAYTQDMTEAFSAAQQTGDEATDFEEPPVMTPGTGPSTAPVTSWSDITWGKDSLTNTSFWSWPERKVIFTVTGGHAKPKHDQIVKVTREAWNAHKKDGVAVLSPTDPVVGEAPAEAEVEEQDDYNDLI